MAKSFETQVLDKDFQENQKLDPFIFATPEVDEFIKRVNFVITGKFMLSYIASNVLLAPLQTIITSLQLSVSKHRDIYQTEQARTKQLAKLNTEMTVHERRKFQLMIRAGGKSIPYTAPVYNGYKQTIEGLKSQGWQAFYKGLSFRTLMTFFYLYPFTQTSVMISNEDIEQGPVVQYLKLFGQCLMMDLILNPIHMLENRYVLQNRIPQFKTIRKPFNALKKMMKQGEAYRGIGYHVINNCVGLFTRSFMYIMMMGNQGINPLMYGLFLAGELVTYPFSTAFKRLQCQTERYPGMIPVRYSGLFHALKVIGYEEGVKGLWRGFSLHTVQTLIRLKLLEQLNKGVKQTH